jgi:MinD-like ATPase involved in chromosome partitioning or flagellar assembly
VFFVIAQQKSGVGKTTTVANLAVLLVEIAGHVPAPVLADLLGINIPTATRWAEIAGRPWSDYPTLRRRQSGTEGH